MDPSYGDQVIEAPPEDDEEQKKPAPPASTGSPFIDALIGAVTGADLPSTGGGTNAAVDDPRGYGTDYAPSSPAPGYAFTPPTGNNGLDDPRGYGDAYGGRSSPNDAGGTGVDPYGPSAPADWGATNAAPVSDTPWDQTPYFPGAAPMAAPRDWGNTNAAPTATEIPPFAGGLFDPWTSSAEAAGTTKNPITAMREAEETQTARNTNATGTAVAGVNRDARTATALAVNDARRAAASATADARRDLSANSTETARGVNAERTAVAQEARDTRNAAATATHEALMAGTPEAQQRTADAKDAAIATKEARSEAATATREARIADATATKEAERSTPTPTKAPDPDKDATDGLKYLADAAKLEQDAPVVNHQRQVPIEAQMARDQGNFLLNRARIARGLPPVATATPARPGAAPAGADYGTPTADYGTPGPASTPLATISQAFARGPVQPDAVEQNTVSDGGLDGQKARPPVDYGPGPDEAAALYAPQTTGAASPAFDPAQADAIAAGRNDADVPPAPRTRTSATPTSPVGEFGGDTSGGAVPLDPDLMGQGATGGDQQAFLDGILSRIPRTPSASDEADAIAAGRNAAGTPGDPGVLPPADTAPVPRNGAVVPPHQQAAVGSAYIAPIIEEQRASFEKAFGDLGPGAVDHAMALATLESSTRGGPTAHNTDGEDSRGMMQINVGPGANTDLRTMDLFDPDQNARAARIVYDRRGWGAWSTEPIYQRNLQNNAMPGSNGLPGTVSPGDMTGAAQSGRVGAEVNALSDAVSRAAVEVPNQFGDPSLSTQEAYAACGPAAAVAFAKAQGRNPTLREAMDLAKTVGWTPAGGMNGVANEKALLDRLGVASTLDTQPSPETIRAQAVRGNPVVISTPAHYYVADAVDPTTGALHVGQSGLARKGGAAWMTIDRISAADGGVNGALYLTGGRDAAPSASASADMSTAVAQAGSREASMPGASGGLGESGASGELTKSTTGAKTPRPALTGNETQDNRNWVAWKLQTDPSFQIPGAEDDAAKKAAAGPHKGDIPTNKPGADPGHPLPSTPIATSPSGAYRLSDGNTKTIAEMRTELTKLGWAGDVNNEQAVLAAYQRTTGKTLTPAPAGPLSQADRQAQVSRWTPNIAQVGAGLNVPADVALAAIDIVSQGDPTHAGGLMGVPAGSVPAGTPLTDGNTSIKAGLTQLASLYAANGNDWGKAFGAYLTGLGIQPGAIDGAVSAFNTARSAYLAPPPPAPAK